MQHERLTQCLALEGQQTVISNKKRIFFQWLLLWIYTYETLYNLREGQGSQRKTFFLPFKEIFSKAFLMLKKKLKI